MQSVCFLAFSTHVVVVDLLLRLSGDTVSSDDCSDSLSLESSLSSDEVLSEATVTTYKKIISY